MLDALVRGKGIPRNQRGVWTEEEDWRLTGIGEVVDWLGERVMSARWQRDMGWEEEVFGWFLGKLGGWGC